VEAAVRNDAGRLVRDAAGRLDEVRRRGGLSQLDLGRLIGRSQSWVCSVLRGGTHSPVKLRSLALLADGLGMELVVDVRPQRPIASAADPSGECFQCPCGFTVFGPAGEVWTDWSPDKHCWLVWIPAGPSSYQLQVEDHVNRCLVAGRWMKVEHF
jgi:transcriptional regulator with XRE-family HTH domain